MCMFVCMCMYGMHLYMCKYEYVCACMHIFLIQYVAKILNFKGFVRSLRGIRPLPGTLFLLQLELVMDTRDTGSLDVTVENNPASSQDSAILETPSEQVKAAM